MEDVNTREPLLVLSTFQKKLSGLEEKYETLLHALVETESEGASSTLQHVILLESATEDASVRTQSKPPASRT